MKERERGGGKEDKKVWYFVATILYDISIISFLCLKQKGRKKSWMPPLRNMRDHEDRTFAQRR